MAEFWGHAGLRARSAHKSKRQNDVSKQLEKEQKFETQYERFFNLPAGSTYLTFFNPFGPVAIIEEAPTPPQRLIDAFSKLQEAHEIANQIMEVVSSKPEARNRFGQVGVALTEYSQSLADIVHPLELATHALDAAYGTFNSGVAAALSDFDRCPKSVN